MARPKKLRTVDERLDALKHRALTFYENVMSEAEKKGAALTTIQAAVAKDILNRNDETANRAAVPVKRFDPDQLRAAAKIAREDSKVIPFGGKKAG